MRMRRVAAAAFIVACGIALAACTTYEGSGTRPAPRAKPPPSKAMKAPKKGAASASVALLRAQVGVQRRDLVVGEVREA
jgi:hypothetical protein